MPPWLCPPGLPGRRSRAAQALVAPAGAKLPRTLSAGKDPGTGDKVIALSKAVRPHHRPTGWLAGAGKVLTFTVVLWEHQKRPGLGVAAFSPKQPSRAPQAQEAGAFWVHRPKGLSIRNLFIPLRKVAAVFLRWVRWGRTLVLACVTEKVPPADFDSLRGERGCFACCSVAPFHCGCRLVVFWWPFLGWCVTEDVYSLTASPAGGSLSGSPESNQRATRATPWTRRPKASVAWGALL